MAWLEARTTRHRFFVAEYGERSCPIMVSSRASLLIIYPRCGMRCMILPDICRVHIILRLVPNSPDGNSVIISVPTNAALVHLARLTTPLWVDHALLMTAYDSWRCFQSSFVSCRLVPYPSTRRFLNDLGITTLPAGIFHNLTALQRL